MIEKKNASQIRLDIKNSAELSGKKRELISPNEANQADWWKLEDILDNFKTNRYLDTGVGSMNQNKYRVIYAIIGTGIYTPAIGGSCGISEAEIHEVYRMQYYINGFLMKTEQEWRHMIVQKGKQYHEEEQQAYENFKNTPLLNQLINENVPRYYLMGMLNKANAQRRKAHQDLLDLDQELKVGKMNMIEFGERQKELQWQKKHPKKSINLAMWRLSSNSGENKRFRKRKAYINVANRFREYDENINIEIYSGNITQGKELISNYCSWFNTKHGLEIKETQKEHRSQKQKANYQIKNAVSITAKKQKRKEDKRAVYKLQQQGMSARAMEKILPFGRNKINNIVREIEALIDNQE